MSSDMQVFVTVHYSVVPGTVSVTVYLPVSVCLYMSFYVCLIILNTKNI